MSVVNTPRETQETPSHARISFTRGTKAHHPRYSYNSLAYITPVFHALPLSYSLTRSFFLSFPLSPAVSSIFFSLSLSLSLSLVRSLFLSLARSLSFSLPARSTLLPLSLLVPFFYRARLSSSFVYSTLNTLPKKTTASMTITMTTVMVTFPTFLFSSLRSFVSFLPPTRLCPTFKFSGVLKSKSCASHVYSFGTRFFFLDVSSSCTIARQLAITLLSMSRSSSSSCTVRETSRRIAHSPPAALTEGLGSSQDRSFLSTIPPRLRDAHSSYHDFFLTLSEDVT